MGRRERRERSGTTKNRGSRAARASPRPEGFAPSTQLIYAPNLSQGHHDGDYIDTEVLLLRPTLGLEGVRRSLLTNWRPAPGRLGHTLSYRRSWQADGSALAPKGASPKSSSST